MKRNKGHNNFIWILPVILLLLPQWKIYAQSLLDPPSDTSRIHYLTQQEFDKMAYDTVLSFEQRVDMYIPKPGYNFIYREDSSLYLEGTYVRDSDSMLIKHGDFKYYYLNGTLRDKGRYDQNNRTGMWYHYNDEGKLYFTTNYATNHRTYYYENGKLHAEGMMGPKEMDTRRSYEFFNLTSHVGNWKFYGGDEKCACKGTVADDAKIGKWIYYSIDRKNKIKRSYSKPTIRGNYEFLDSCLWR